MIEPVVAWVVSAVRPRRWPLRRARLLAHVRPTRSWRPVDVGFSLATARSLFEHRAVVVGGDRED